MFETLLAAHPYAVLVFDEQGKIVGTNQSATALFGYTEEDFLGKHLSLLLRDEDVTGHASLFEGFKQRHEKNLEMSYSRPVVARHKNGYVFPIDVLVGRAEVDEKVFFIATIRAGSSEKRVEKQLRSIALFPLENPNPVFRIKTTGEIIFVNVSGERLLESIDMPAADTVPIDWVVEAAVALDEQKTRQRIFKYAKHFYSFFFVPIKMMGYVNIFCQDITEWEIEKGRLALSDDILGSIGNLVLVANSNAEIIYVSPSVKQIIGYEPEEVLGDGWWRIDRDSGGNLDLEKEYIRRSALGLSRVDPTPHEHRLFHKNGEERWLRLQDAKGPRDLIIGIGTDITDIRMAKEELQNQVEFSQTLTTQMGQGLVVTDENGKFNFINPYFAKMLGYEIEELIGKTLEDVTFPNNEPTNIHGYTSQLLKESAKSEIRLRGKDDREIFALFTGTPHLIDGKFKGTITVITDLTERRQTENTLRDHTETIRKKNIELSEARDRAVEASNIKSMFLATMSHEIRTPMNAMMGMTELLLDTDLSEEQKEFATVIDVSTKNLLGVLNDILDFSKIEAGKFSINQHEFDLAQLIDDLLKLYGPDAQLKQISITATIDPSIPNLLVGDSGRIGQVLGNLISNAIKFTHEQGTIQIIITGAVLKNKKMMITIRVKDNGEGIPANLHASLFEPFTQADASSTRKHGGTGLGLAISKRLVDLMAGEIGFESFEGSGTTFWVNLPLAIASSVKVTELGLSEKTKQEIELDFKNQKTILVVDDKPINRGVLSMQLRGFNILTRLASNGKEAVNLLKQHPDTFSLVFMDLHMPKMDGFTATKLIRESEVSTKKHLLIIGVTADALSSSWEQCREAGMDDIISKPVLLSHINVKLKKWLTPSKTKENL